jgi:hypothetical protein
MAASNDGARIIAFFRGAGTDHRGRYLRDVLAFSDDELEETHDYIQWLFPLDAPSGVLANAPLVDAACRRAFQADDGLRAALRQALARMLEFYGLTSSGIASAPIISEGENFRMRSAKWLRRYDHNFLRLTRIMRSLVLLGEARLAKALQGSLEVLYQRNSAIIGATTIEFWRGAV